MGYERYRNIDHVDHRPGYDAMGDLQPLKADAANGVNFAIIVGLWALGLCAENPQQWYHSASALVLQILGFHFSTAAAFQLFARSFGQLIQTSDSAPRENYMAEVLQTFLGFGLVCAPLVAWSVVRSDRGQPTAWKWSLAECMLPFAQDWPTSVQLCIYILQVVIGLLFFDTYNYFKHRAFHSHLLWPWHKYHHSHRNPSAFTGYAISPMYGLATFWPLALFANPDIPMFIPIYGTFVGFYLLLNHYLHSGYVLPWLENILAPCYLMTSAWHNTHHNRGRRGWHATDQTFSEMLTLWDIWLGTYPEGAKAMKAT